MPFNFDSIPWIRDQQRRNPVPAPAIEEPKLPPLPREEKAIITEPVWLSWLPENTETEQEKRAREARRKQIGERYLAGRGAPLILSASLKGPFDRSSGWINPWLPKDPNEENGKPVGIHGIYALKALRGDSSAARSAKRRRADNVASARRTSNLLDFSSIGGRDTGVKVPAAKPNLHEGLKSFMPSALENAPGSARKPSGDSAVTASGNKRPSDDSWLKGANIVRRKRKELSEIPSPTPPSRLNGSPRTGHTPQNLLERFREHEDVAFTQEESTLPAIQSPAPKSPQKTAVTPEPYSPPFSKRKRSLCKDVLTSPPVSGSAFYGKAPTQDNTARVFKKSKLRAEDHGSSPASPILEPSTEPECPPRPRGPRPQIESSTEPAMVERLQEEESFQDLKICPVNTILRQDLDFEDLVPHLIAGHLARAAEYIPPASQEGISTLASPKRTETSAAQGEKSPTPENEILPALPQAAIKSRPQISSDSDSLPIAADENDAVAEEPVRSPRPKTRPLDQVRSPSPPGSFKFRRTKRTYSRKSSGMLKQALNPGTRITLEQDEAQSPSGEHEQQLPDAPSVSPEDIVGMVQDANDAREDTAPAVSQKKLSKPSPFTVKSSPSRESTVMGELSTIVHDFQDTREDATISTQPPRPEGEPETQDWPGDFSFIKQYAEIPDQGKENIGGDDEAPMNTATTSTTSMLISAAMAEPRDQEMNEDEADVTINGLPGTTPESTEDASPFPEVEKTPAMREDTADVSFSLRMEEDEIAALPQVSAPDNVLESETKEWPALDISFTQKSVPEVAVEKEEEQEAQEEQGTQESHIGEDESTTVRSILEHVTEATRQASQSQAGSSPVPSHEGGEYKYEASKYSEDSQEEERLSQEVSTPLAFAAAFAAPQGKRVISLASTGEERSSVTHVSQSASGTDSGTTGSRSTEEQCAQRTDGLEEEVQDDDDDMLLDEPVSPVTEAEDKEEQSPGQLRTSQVEVVENSNEESQLQHPENGQAQEAVADRKRGIDVDAEDNWETMLFSQTSHVPETSFSSQKESFQASVVIQVGNSGEGKDEPSQLERFNADHVVPSSMVSIEQQTHSDKETTRPQAAIKTEELVATQEGSSQAAATATVEDNHPVEPARAADSPAVAQSPWQKGSPIFTRAQTKIPKPVQAYTELGGFTMSQSHVAARLFVAASQPTLSSSLVHASQSQPEAVNTDDREVTVVPDSDETLPALPPQKNMVGKELPLPSSPYFSAPIAKMAPTPFPNKAEKTWPHVSPLKPGEAFMSFENPWARGTQVAATQPGNSPAQSQSQSQRNSGGKHKKRVSFSLLPSDDDKENEAESDDDERELPVAKKQRIASSPPAHIKSKSPQHRNPRVSSPPPPFPPLNEPSNLDSDDALHSKLKLVGLKRFGHVEKEDMSATSSPGGMAKAFLEADKMVQKSSALSNASTLPNLSNGSNVSNTAVKGTVPSSPRPHAPAPSTARERQSSVVRNLALLYPSSDEDPEDDAAASRKRSRSRSKTPSTQSQSEKFRSQESLKLTLITDPFANPWNSETLQSEPELSGPAPVEEEEEYDGEEPAPFALGSIMGMLGKDFGSQSNVGRQDGSQGVGEVVDQMSDLLDTWDIEEELRKERGQSGRVAERRSTARERVGWRGC